jgi:tetratricopeptide (TPR) repeat protein
MKKLLTLLLVFFVFETTAQKKDYDKFIQSGKAKFEAQDFTGALLDFTDATKAQPKVAEGYYWLGMTYYYLYKDAEALVQYNKALDVDPKYEPALFERGFLNLTGGNYSAAQVDFNKVTQINPNDPLVWYNLGLCKYNLGDMIGAVADYNKCLNLDTKNVSAWHNRGIAKYSLGDNSGAIKDLTQVLELDPSHQKALYYRGLCYYNQYEYEKSIADYTKLLSIDAKYKDAYYNRGLAFHYSGKYDMAASDFGKLIDLDPTDYEAYYRRGLAKNELKDYAGSAADHKQSLKLKPGFESAQKELDFLGRYLEKETETKPVVKKPEKRLPQMWAVVVGISKYQDQSINLKYADKDAKAIHDFLASPYGGALDSEHLTLLTNENATRANIIKALTEKFYRAFETDMVILFIASHGQPDPVGNEVYFLGYDTDKNNLSGTGVSQIDIEKIFSRSPAGKKIWMADACHSGGAGLSVGMRGAAEDAEMINRLLIQMVVAKKGMAMFTASSSSEYSFESDRWGGGHGAFTYHLLKGLKGEADLDGNEFVEIRELYEYVYRNVSKDTNGKQHPELKGNFDNNLPLSIVPK